MPLPFLLAICLVLVPLSGFGRNRIEPDKLGREAKNDFNRCDSLAEAFANAPAKNRTEAARALLKKAKEFSNKNPDVFRGWVWQAQAALELNSKETGREAMRNMIELGGARSTSPQIMAVLSAIEASGWMDTHSGDNDTGAGNRQTVEPQQPSAPPAAPVVQAPAGFTQYAGSVGNLSYQAFLKIGPNGRVAGYYYYDRNPDTHYTLTGVYSNKNLKLQEFTGSELTANITLHRLNGSSSDGRWAGEMNNTTGQRPTFIMDLHEVQSNPAPQDVNPVSSENPSSQPAALNGVTTFLAVRSAAGAGNPESGRLTPENTLEILITGSEVLVSGTSWAPIRARTSQGDVTGWVNKKYLTSK